MFGGNYFYFVNIIVRTNWDRRVENQPLEITTTNNYLSATRNWQRRIGKIIRTIIISIIGRTRTLFHRGQNDGILITKLFRKFLNPSLEVSYWEEFWSSL